jgi:AraC family transcriptional regulator, regulatory protein of adaptative response / methylated-DNA-[protein]-cysteine methyltransferase
MKGNTMISEIRFSITECSLGYLLIARSTRGLCASLLGDDARSLRQDLAGRFPNATLLEVRVSDDPLLERAVALVESDGTDAELPLDLQGTPFQLRVWQALREVGPGYTTTYAGIAARIGSPRAIRAVAQACAANPLAVAIPCHRVVCSNGELSGYRWGIERKRALLAREVAA